MSYARSKTRSAAVGDPAVGDTVCFDYGAGLMVTGTVVEDRGRIGAGGRHLWRVRIDPELGNEPMFIELPDDALTVVKHVA